MPLTPFQEGLAWHLSSLRTEDSYLAGGAALNLSPESRRFSNDLDYFHDSEERVAKAFEDDRQALEKLGYFIKVVLHQPGFIKAVVSKDREETKVEWAHDSCWRFLPPIRHEKVGYTLHPIDLSINKLLALVGRDEIRDYIDIHDIIDKVLPLGPLCWAASGKDPGFTPLGLIDLLRRRGRARPEELKRLDLNVLPDLTELKSRWLVALEDAVTFVEGRPPEEVGCLYYNMETHTFVEPQDGTTVHLHFGRPGGMLPSVK